MNKIVLLVHRAGVSFFNGNSQADSRKNHSMYEKFSMKISDSNFTFFINVTTSLRKLHIQSYHFQISHNSIQKNLNNNLKINVSKLLKTGKYKNR